MRRLILLCLGALLVVPATALGVVPFASGDGTVAVRDGAGLVKLQLPSSVILGRVEDGELRVFDPDTDCDALDRTTVWNNDDLDVKFVSKPGVRQTPSSPRRVPVCVFTSDTPMRFRLLDEGNVRVKGDGIWVSAVGRGKVWLEGQDDKANDGKYSINGAPFRSLPDDGGWLDVKGS
jgi:hypothetical protein